MTMLFEPESCQMAKMLFFLHSFFFLSSFFFSSSASSDGLVQNCVTLSQWFLHRTAVFTLSSAPAHHFFTTLKQK